MKRRLRRRSVRKGENPGKYDLLKTRSSNCVTEEGIHPLCPALLLDQISPERSNECCI